jgi:Glycosyl transferases group 1
MGVNNYIREIAPAPLRDMTRAVRRRLGKRRARRPEPVIVQHRGQLIQSRHSFVIVCGPYFNQTVPNAGVTCRTGLARAFEELGIGYEFVSVRDVRRVDELSNPIIFLSEPDFECLDKQQLRIIKKHRHFVWVNPWFAGERKLYERHNFDLAPTRASVRRRVFESEPEFVYTPVTVSGLHHYEGWSGHVKKIVSLPLACDTRLYELRQGQRKFAEIGMAFVGGYWPYKARNFDLFLKPYESKLTIFGYSPWPYAGYGGQLSEADEPLLYRDAVLSPAINEPHAAVLGGDICERVYKVLGSGGLCITDTTRAHRDIFSSRELLVPESLDEYHQLVRSIFHDPSKFDSYREAGYRAVRERHTYRHRALEILKYFDLAEGYVGQNAAPANGGPDGQ